MSVKPKNSPFTVGTIQKYKNENRKITALTAYDYSTAKLMDEAGIDLILVGDSLSMVALGNTTTHPVTVDEMIHHTKAVARGVERALIVTDMPFMSYQTDMTTALTNAGRFIQEANAQAVKIEGCSNHILSVVKRCVEAGIPVLAHLGFTPQFLHTLGGYKIQGKNLEATEQILKQALALQESGVFGVVLEMVPEESAKLITDKLDIPTIGIGAGRYCSGQILVTDDILGKYTDFTPKFARKYVDLASLTKNAFNEYKEDVISGKFPSTNEVFNLNEEELNKLRSIDAEK
jgi:3-methyl-2-oxobutanoate hydroxymethyltransferase